MIMPPAEKALGNIQHLLMIKKKKKKFAFTILFNIGLEILANVIRQRKYTD